MHRWQELESKNALLLPDFSKPAIAELVESRHDKVKQSIERLVERGVISQPPVGDWPKSSNGVVIRVYLLSKRDSYVVVAQLSPEFTARLVDRWQELKSKNGILIPDFSNPAIYAQNSPWSTAWTIRSAVIADSAAQVYPLTITRGRLSSEELCN